MTTVTESFTETTQIWGKEFPGCMKSMKPGNSSFFVVHRDPQPCDSPHQPSPSVHLYSQETRPVHPVLIPPHSRKIHARRRLNVVGCLWKNQAMKKTLALLCLCFTLPSAAFAGSTRENLQARIDAAKTVLDEIMAAQDNTIPMNIIERATCVAIVPGMLKGAFIGGIQYGQGVVTAGARRSSFAWLAGLLDFRSAVSPPTWCWWPSMNAVCRTC